MQTRLQHRQYNEQCHDVFHDCTPSLFLWLNLRHKRIIMNQIVVNKIIDTIHVHVTVDVC